jgi:hypothetical protein
VWYSMDQTISKWYRRQQHILWYLLQEYLKYFPQENVYMLNFLEDHI